MSCSLLRCSLIKARGGSGVTLEKVSRVARQLLQALQHIHQQDIIHCDLKPDNILISSSDGHSRVLICDFGVSVYRHELEGNGVTRRGSMWYSAPEVILGLTMDSTLDMWALGCCLYELYTGKVLFQEKDDNGMLHKMVALKGRFPSKVVKESRQLLGAFADHSLLSCNVSGSSPFTEGGRLRKNTGRKTAHGGRLWSEVIMPDAPSEDLLRKLETHGGANGDAKHTKVRLFADLLHGCLTLRRKNRLTAARGLLEPFMKCKLK